MELKEAVQIIINRYQTDNDRINGEKNVIERYGKIFAPENLINLTAYDFKSFLLIKNNMHWDGIHRMGNILVSDMARLIKVLTLLLDEKIPLKTRLDKIIPPKGNMQPMLKGLGKAVLTPILLVVYPDKYAVYNTTVEVAMKQFGILPEQKHKSFSSKYIEVNTVINNLAREYGLSLWQMDEVWWVGKENKLPMSNELIPEDGYKPDEAYENQYPADVESQLESLLINNWDKISEFMELEILQEDGEFIGQQYDTKEIGRIDLLCKNKKSNDYVVIELKRGREGDKVVGQTLRYIGWVKKNLAKSSQNVKGMIITYENDKKLSYALESIKDLIELKFYKISISIS